MSEIRRLVLALVTLLAFAAPPAGAQLALPSDVLPSCTVTGSELAGWFVSGSPSPNGAITPADSVQFPTANTVCDFFTWGARMFLWLTSPSDDGLVLDSTAMFNVLPPDSRGVRHLQSNSGNPTLQFGLRAEKFDSIGEVGQAGGDGVLMSQNKSLVYYGVHVNDVYAYFLTGQKSGKISATVFPRNANDLATVVSYTKKAFPGVTLQAPETLVMELKTSWVDAATVPDARDFVTIQAVVPTFVPNGSNTQWKQSGTETLTLALVGVHIVGTVQNHPEFVWITYEHILNAPDAAYYYFDGSDKIVRQPFDSTGTFLFMTTGGAEAGANVECMKFSSGAIVANTKSGQGSTPVCAGGIVPSNTVRTYPWGSQADSQNTGVVTNNTLLLSINESIRSQLSAGDVRANYVQTGGIWTSAPSATADAPIPDTSGFEPSALRGSLQAFNATMETYNQGTSCFSCHQQAAEAPNSFQAFELSHIYSQIAPLTPGSAGRRPVD